MSTDQPFVCLKYEDAKETIDDILQKTKLPVVVKSVDDGVNREKTHICAETLPLNTEILLHCILKVKHAHVKVLNYHDNEVKEKEMGPEFVLEHDSYVGEEFLIPAKYGGAIKFIRRPKSRGRFATVSMIMEALPRFVLVLEDLKAHPVNDNKFLQKTIRKNTTLEILEVTKPTATEEKQLIVFDGNEKYALKETGHINAREVDDERTYHLYEHVRNRMLPKVIQFDSASSQDVISYSSQNNTIDMAIVDGPLELIGYVDLQVLVGWIRNKSDKSYTTILIPRAMWKTAIFQQRALHTLDDKTQYIRRKFGYCQEIQFVENGLYTRIIDDYNVIYLRSPAFYKRSQAANTMFAVEEIQFEESSDDERNDDDEEGQGLYLEIGEDAPAIPERIPMIKQVKKKKTIFDKVHKEIVGLKFKLKSIQFHDKAVSDDPPRLHPKPKQYQRSLSNQPSSPKVASVQRSMSHMNERPKPETKRNRRNSHDDQASPIASPLSPSASPVSKNISGDYSYAACDLKSSPSPVSKNRPEDDSLKSGDVKPNSSRLSDEYDSDPYDCISYVDKKSTKRPLPAIPTETMNQASGTSVKEEGHPKHKPTYTKLVIKDASAVSADTPTEDDFYKYTVKECSDCFRFCGLSDFADKCFAHNLDGAFFRNINLKTFKEDPFYLIDIEIKKVEQIISGWRPKYEEKRTEHTFYL